MTKQTLLEIAVKTATAAAIVVASTAGVIAVTRVMGGPALSVNQISTNKMSTFDAMGEAKINTIPDQAEVRMGIAITDTTVKVTQDKANTVINSVNEKMAELGIEKSQIKTENYSLYPNYDYSSGSNQRITGYTLNTNLVVTIKDFAKLNQAVDAATAAGANQIGGITFSLSDDKKEEVEKEAREEAIGNAQEKARELAGLAGMKLGKIVNIYEVPNAVNYPYPMAEVAYDMAKGAGGGAPTNVEPGSTTYTYQVTLSYETL